MSSIIGEIRPAVLVGFLAPARHPAAALLAKALPKDWGIVVSMGDVDAPGFSERLSELHYIISAATPFSRQHIEKAPKLKLLHKLGVGYNELDLAALRERGIAVAVCPVGVADAVSEHTLALTLATMKCIANFDAAARLGRWPADSERIKLLSGRRVGIVGFGRIGRATAALFVAFGCSVEVLTRSRPAVLSEHFEQLVQEGKLVFSDGIEGLFERCSVVSLHAPLTDATRNLVLESHLEMLGSEGVFINTSRGGLVDEAALARVLSDGRLGCAGLDVFQNEPPAPHPQLLACPNVVLTPHVAAAGREVLERKLDFIFRNLQRFQATGAAYETV